MLFLRDKKSVVLLAMIGMFAVNLSSCKKKIDPGPVVYGEAKISVTNTVFDSNPQDFYQDDKKISSTPVSYEETSPYLTLKAGASFLHFKNTGTMTMRASQQVFLYKNISYTAFYYINAAGAGKITGLANDPIAPAAGKIKVRFVNLGPTLNNALNISITGGAVLVNGLTFGKETFSYSTLDVNTALEVSVVNSNVTVPIPSTSFVSGKNYTVWFDAASSTTAKVHVIEEL